MSTKHISFCLFVLSALFVPTLVLVCSLDSLHGDAFSVLYFLLPAVVFTAVVLIGACARRVFLGYTSTHLSLSKAESSFTKLSSLAHLPKGCVQKESIQRILKKVH